MRIAVDGIYFGLLQGLDTGRLIWLAVDSGAEGVNWPFHDSFDAGDLQSVARQLSDAGQAAVSLALTSHTSGEPGAEQAFRDHLGRSLDAAHTIGTRVLDAWPRRPQDVTKAAAQETLRANLDYAVPLLQDAGCVLTFEFEPDHTVERYAEALAFVADYAPHVALTADTYHINRIGDSLPAAASALKGHMGVIHISGSHRGEPGSEGDVCDYAGFLAAALGDGYEGDLVLQYAAEGEALDSLKRAIVFTRDLVAAAKA